MAVLRQRRVCSVIFIDNILLMAQSQEELTQITKDQLGESALRIIFLGFIVDTLMMVVKEAAE